jgi:hypothetical protein
MRRCGITMKSARRGVNAWMAVQKAATSGAVAGVRALRLQVRSIGRIIIARSLWMISSSSRMSLRRLLLGRLRRRLLRRLLLRRRLLLNSRWLRCSVGLGCRGRVRLRRKSFCCTGSVANNVPYFWSCGLRGKAHKDLSCVSVFSLRPECQYIKSDTGYQRGGA